MDEIRKNQIIHLELKDKTKLEGIVFDYVHDRISILIAFDSLEQAKKVRELDILLANVQTHVGLKRMFCHVISELGKDNCIVIENNDSIPIEQKRQFARVVSNMTFKVKKETAHDFVNCFCVDLSGASIAFSCPDETFNIGDIINIILPSTEFEKEIRCKANIIKINKNAFVAKFVDMSPHDENKVVKYVFKLIAKK
ncbi:MAG: PilZ domain-containing protein [Candidatus Gastranaerophilales bacterium]|nr:PilZ domain-containing protein [Candidatus Gastranaerophilales bacterium]